MDKSLHICLISKQFPPGIGGAETYAYELANGLADRGHKVDVYTQWVDDPNETADVHEDVSVHRICKARRKLVTFETLWFSLTARREIDFEVYDIVHGTMMPASTVVVTLFNHIGTPIVLTSHGTSIGEMKAVALETAADYLLKYLFHPINIIMDYIASRDADQVIAISDHAYNQLKSVYGLDNNSIDLIPHGVDTDWFYPREKKHPGVSPDKLTLLYVGRLGARKGVDLVIQALSNVDTTHIELLIAGTGRHGTHLQELVSELGIKDQVHFLGRVPDSELPVLYSSSDVFVLPSRYEGFGLVLLEAMACGTPVIGTDVGGIPTAIKHGQNGIVTSRTVTALTQEIQSLITNDGITFDQANDSDTRLTLSSWHSVARRVETIYNKALQYR